MIDAPHQRLLDLLRYCRGRLHEANLISDEEYAVLAADHDAVARLEAYDVAKRQGARDFAQQVLCGHCPLEALCPRGPQLDTCMASAVAGTWRGSTHEAAVLDAQAAELAEARKARDEARLGALIEAREAVANVPMPANAIVSPIVVACVNAVCDIINHDPPATEPQPEPAALTALRAEAAQVAAFLGRAGYRRCDIPACNCGSFHGGHAEDRLREIGEALDEAGAPKCGGILVKRIAALVAGPSTKESA
jgi:hypothetical protein